MKLSLLDDRILHSIQVKNIDVNIRQVEEIISDGAFFRLEKHQVITEGRAFLIDAEASTKYAVLINPLYSAAAGQNAQPTNVFDDVIDRARTQAATSSTTGCGPRCRTW